MIKTRNFYISEILLKSQLNQLSILTDSFLPPYYNSNYNNRRIFSVHDLTGIGLKYAVSVNTRESTARVLGCEMRRAKMEEFDEIRTAMNSLVIEKIDYVELEGHKKYSPYPAPNLEQLLQRNQEIEAYLKTVSWICRVNLHFSDIGFMLRSYSPSMRIPLNAITKYQEFGMSERLKSLFVEKDIYERDFTKFGEILFKMYGTNPNLINNLALSYCQEQGLFNPLERLT